MIWGTPRRIDRDHRDRIAARREPNMLALATLTSRTSSAYREKFAVTTYLSTVVGHIDETRSRLERTSRRAKVAFATSCAEQLAPLFERFSREHAYLDAAEVRRWLDVAWSCAEGDEVSFVDVQHAVDSCDAAIPSSDEFPPLSARGAANAGLATANALDCCLDDDAEAAVGAAERVIEVLEWVLEPNDDGDEVPAPIAAELRRQRSVLAALDQDLASGVRAARVPEDPAAVARLFAAATARSRCRGV